ncbi:MAG: sulfatase [bacterium]
MPATRPNILLITADDMNWDAVGAYGCETPGTTPHIDKLATEGMRFDQAHVTIAVCQPSRSALMTGRYPHRSGGEGFHHLRHADVPILPRLLRDAGYTVGVLGKVGHSTPHEDFQWDVQPDMEELGMGRSPAVYGKYAESFFQSAQDADQPFFMMANSHDPHRPFVGNDPGEWYTQHERPASEPSRTFTLEQVTVPGFLPDLPEVRREIAEYYSSVRRCDDTVGELLGALERTGAAENTLVMFLSDNGMAFPFSKTNCYLHSTRTPWIARWPARIAAGGVDREHFISGVDFLPTAIEAAGVAMPEGVDGGSFLSLLDGQQQDGRELVFTQFHQTAMRRNYPMRCVQDGRFGYIWNPWADGERVFRNESQSGRTMPAMQRAAENDPAIAQRVDMFLYRVPEELYDFERDPDALKNLVDSPEHQDELNRLRSALAEWMGQTGDPAGEYFTERASREAMERLMQAQTQTLGGE